MLAFIFGEARAGSLVVGLLLDPVAWSVVSDEVFSGLVVDEDEKRKWHWYQPPVPLEWVHSEGNIGTWHVGQDGSQKSLLEQTGDHDLVSHTLLEDR